MAQTNQRVYNCSSMKQLIDLNGQYTNFRVKFDLRSIDGKPFQAVIVDQTILDSGDQLSFREAPTGELMGEMVADNNVYQNYFLVLRSDSPVDVHVTITFEPLPDYIKKESFQETTSTEGGQVLTLRNLCIVLLLIGGGYVLYKEWKKRTVVSVSENKSILTSMEEIAHQ